MSARIQKPALRRPARDSGFTVIELLVVVAIIMLLLGMVVPSIHRAISLGYAANSAAHIRSLAAGIDLYKQDTGYYPGQKYDFGGLEGSQGLARAMFTPKGGSFPDDWPQSAYCSLEDGKMLESTNPADDPFVLDGYPDGNPIHYYPSKIGKEGKPAHVQYDSDDGPHHSKPNVEGYFNQFITRGTGPSDWESSSNPPADSVPYNDGKYILVAPGPDGMYFTNDDVTNFQRETVE